MGKHSDMDRKERDFYSTPLAATAPLVPYLGGIRGYIEPFAGDGRLIDNFKLLAPDMKCVWASDMEPLAEGIEKEDFDEIDTTDLTMSMIEFHADAIISNPPWLNTPSSGYQLFRFINKMCKGGFPVIMLLNANLVNNKSSWQNKVHGRSLMELCYQVLPIGRVKWIDNSPFSAKEDSAWYFFNDNNRSLPKILPRK
jgi:hypothetical protein